MAIGLTVTWTDPRGKVWDLTRGTEGVLLDLGQKGWGWSELEHVFTRGDSQWAASRVKRGIHELKVTVGWSPDTGYFEGDAYYRLADEWWSLANSPFEKGTLTVTRPDGVQRSRRLRLWESPATEYTYDPGIGQEPEPELWALTGDGGFWQGAEQSFVYRLQNMSGGNGTPFYGNSGSGWPLYISSGATAAGAVIDNLGQGPMWLTWTLIGPMSNPRFGADGGVLAYNGFIPAGEVIEVVTDPAGRTVVEQGSGENRYGFVDGVFSPAPVGKRIPLVISAEGMTSASSITVTAREQFARAF